MALDVPKRSLLLPVGMKSDFRSWRMWDTEEKEGEQVGAGFGGDGIPLCRGSSPEAFSHLCNLLPHPSSHGPTEAVVHLGPHRSCLQFRAQSLTSTTLPVLPPLITTIILPAAVDVTAPAFQPLLQALFITRKLPSRRRAPPCAFPFTFQYCYSGPERSRTCPGLVSQGHPGPSDRRACSS